MMHNVSPADDEASWSPGGPLPTGKEDSVHKGCILIVEDEDDLAQLLSYHLHREDYQTVHAADGLAACRLFEETKPDVVLLDIMLPGVDGFEVCRRIREHAEEERASTPIIMLTALCALDQKYKGLAAGADAYLPKPYQFKEILRKIDRLITKRRKQPADIPPARELCGQEPMQANLQRLLFHELKSQLMIISAITERIASKTGDCQALKEKGYFQALLKSTVYLNSLVEEVCTSSQMESEDFYLTRHAFSLNEVMENMVRIYEPLAENNQVKLTYHGCEERTTVELNRTAMQVILSSIIENAVKYSRGEVAIRLSVCEDLNGEGKIEVEDNGPGIPESELQDIFKKYFRGRQALSSTKGTGLGLYLASALTEKQKGRIEVHSSVGKGSRFQLYFPLCRSTSVC